MIDRQDLNAFLWFCYLPRSSARFLDPVLEDEAASQILRKHLAQLSLHEAVKEGDRVLRQVFQRLLSSVQGLQVVPLSGGLDSRLILAHLVEAGLREQIVAVTFGTPGTLDFEIPKTIVKHLKVRHESFDLTELGLTYSDLKYAYHGGATWVELITAHYNHMLKRHFGEQTTYWSGFLGGPVAGSMYRPGYENMTWEDAKKLFASHNWWSRKTKKSIHEPGYTPESALPDRPFLIESDILTYYEQLQLTVKQISWFHKAVVGDFPNVHTPFAEPDWIKFITSSPINLRIDCKLYYQIMLYQFPTLFHLQTKSATSGYLVDTSFRKYSRRTKAIYRKMVGYLGYQTPAAATVNLRLNYIDFAEAFRTREDFRTLAKESVSHLAESGIIDWLEPFSLLEKHLRGDEDLSQELLLLISLDINMQLQQQNSLRTDHGTN